MNHRPPPGSRTEGDEAPRDAPTGRTSGLAQAISVVTRRLRLASGSSAQSRGRDTTGEGVAADDEAIRRAFLDAELEPARRPPRPVDLEQPEAAAEPVDPEAAGTASAALASPTVATPDIPSGQVASDELALPAWPEPAPRVSSPAPASAQDPTDVPESVTVAADDFFSALVRRVERHP